MNKSAILLLLVKNKKIVLNKRNYSLIATKMDEIEKGKKAAAYKAIDENINNVKLFLFFHLYLSLLIAFI